jgi:D-amino-acid dehydrogenase
MQAAGKATGRRDLSPRRMRRARTGAGRGAPLLAGGIFNSGEAVADCHAFCGLAARVRAHPRFRGLVQAEARGIAATGGGSPGSTPAPALIGGRRLRAGGRHPEPQPGRHAGISLPLYPLKGYSLTAPIRATDTAPEISVTDFERKVLYARIGDKLRVAAMVDMVGEDLTLTRSASAA